MRFHLRSKKHLGLAVAALLLGLLGCTTDSPTEPQQAPSGGGGGGTPSTTTWNITLQSSRNSLDVSSNRSAAITFRVRNAANGGLPPEGATVSVATSLGELNAPGSGVLSALVSLLSGEGQVLLFPGDEVGVAVVQVRLEQSFGQISIPIVQPDSPPETPVPDVFFIDRVEPPEGSPEGGETVRILGQLISEPIRVFFGGLPAEVLSSSSSSIRVVTPRRDDVPPAGRLTVDVVVTINANHANEDTDTLVAGFTYTREPVELQPEIFSVTPNVGPNEGGTRVTINGDGFQSPVQVTFEGAVTLEAEVESVSRTQIVVRSPAAVGFGAQLANSSVTIRVKNQLNGLEDLLVNAFRYGIQFQIFGIDPTSGPAEGGTRVTIFGEGFDEPLVVDFGSTRQQVTSVTGNQILVRTVPVEVNNCSASGGGGVSVTHLESNATVSNGTFTYVVELPEITGTSPATIPQNGGVVRIFGSNFDPPMLVAIQTDDGPARPVLVNTVTENEINTSFPLLPDSDLQTNPCDDNGDGFTGERLVITPARITVTDDDTGCMGDFLVNVQPSNTTCVNDVAPTPTPTPAPPTPTPTATP